MAKKIGSLYAVLGLNDKKFQKGFKDATRSMKKFGRDMKKIGTQLGKSFLVGATATTAALVYMTKNAMEQADELGKLSDRLGIATEKLGGLQYAARITGASSESLNKALEKMGKNLGDAALGTGLAKKSLESMGFDVNKLINMDANTQFLTIGDAIGKLGTQSEKAAASMAIFGRDGMSMINMFDEGVAGIEKYQQAAERLGFTFTRIEAKQIENANDALETLKTLMTVIGGRLAVEFAGVIKTIADRLVDAGNSGEGFKARVQRAIEIGLKGGMKLTRAYEALAYALNAAALGASVLALGLAKAASGLVQLEKFITEPFKKAFVHIDSFVAASAIKMKMKFQDAILFTIKKLQSLANAFNSVLGVFGMKINFADHLAGEMERAKELNQIELDGITAASKKAIADIENELDNNAWVKSLEAFATKAEKAMDGLVISTNKAFDNMADNKAFDEIMDQIKKIKLESENMAKAQVEAAKGVTKAAATTIEEAGQAAADANEKALKQAENDTNRWADSLSSTFATLMQEGQFTFKSIGAAIRDMALQQVFTKASSGIVGTLLNIGSAIGSGAKNQAGATATMTGGSGGVGSGGYGTPSIIQHLSFGEGVNEASRAAVVSMMPSIQGATAAGVRDAAARRGG